MSKIGEIVAVGFIAATLGQTAAATPAEAAKTFLQNGGGMLTGVVVGGDDENFAATLTREIEGYPNPNGDGSCTLVRQPVLDIRGNLIGFHTFPACR